MYDYNSISVQPSLQAANACDVIKVVCYTCMYNAVMLDAKCRQVHQSHRQVSRLLSRDKPLTFFTLSWRPTVARLPIIQVPGITLLITVLIL